MTTEPELGNCFPVAFRLCCDHGYILCHGTVKRPDDGLRHAHAWVEHTDTYDVPLHDGSGTVEVELTVAIDKSNGHDMTLPVEVYHRVGRTEDVERYTRDQAMRLAVQTGHYGPWS